MQTVKIKKDRLLETVKKNKEVHVQEFKESIDGYAEELGKQLQEKMTTLSEGEIPEQAFDNLPMPKSHEDDYEHIIAMLEFSSEDEVELEAHEFSQYVLDKWGWKKEFRRLSSNYSKKF